MLICSSAIGARSNGRYEITSRNDETVFRFTCTFDPEAKRRNTVVSRRFSSYFVFIENAAHWCCTYSALLVGKSGPGTRRTAATTRAQQSAPDDRIIEPKTFSGVSAGRIPKTYTDDTNTKPLVIHRTRSNTFYRPRNLRPRSTEPARLVVQV